MLRLFSICMVLTFGCGAKSALEEDPSPSRARPDLAMPEDDAFVPPDLSTDGGPDRPPRPCVAGPRPVDIVFVTDTSASMEEELQLLAEHIPVFLRDLVEPPDVDGDGSADWPAVEDVHIAIAPTHLEGAFATTGDPERPECARSYPLFHTLGTGDDVDTVAADVSCVATQVAPGSSEPLLGTAVRSVLRGAATFRGPLGRNLGDNAHRGFLRPDSILVLLFISDEDDDTGCFRIERPECEEVCRVTSAGETICGHRSSPTAYAEELRAFRPGGRLFVGTLAGAPIDATEEAEIVAAFDARRRGTVVCSRGLINGLTAYRLAEFTFAADGVYRSICSDDYRSLVEPIARGVGDVACAP